MKLIIFNDRTTIKNSKFKKMNSEQLEQMINWLNLEIVRLNDSIIDAQQTNNYGRKTQYEGMRDAFTKFLNEFNSTKEEKRMLNKRSKSNI